MILVLFLITTLFFMLYMQKKNNVILNILQINSYENKKTLNEVKKRSSLKDKLEDSLFLLPLLLLISRIWGLTLLIAAIAEASFILISLYLTHKEKKKFLKNTKKTLVDTNRVKRIRAVNLVILVVLVLISAIACLNIKEIYSFNVSKLFYANSTLANDIMVALITQSIAYTLISLLGAEIIILSNYLLKPVEKRINDKFINEAKEKLESMPNLKIIGITGSYGKTSTKYILDGILSYKYNVCKTPGSFNTPLGVVKTIRENLKVLDEIFIAEMGARHTNDIKELCDIVKPQYGIITAIGNQHLETFKSIENIKNTKYDLVRKLEGAKKAFINIDNQYLKELISEEKVDEVQHETVCYSLKDSEADYYATNLQYTRSGATFDVYVQKELKAKITTKLLGVHNVYNTLGAIAIANTLGMSMEEIAKAAQAVKPVEHRLEILKSNAQVTVIDDTFNANPEGSKEALEVLNRMEGNKKIIITPGMIELGSKQYELNFEFGERCAKICDYTIMVGQSQTYPMQEAFKNLDIDKEKYYVAKDLNDATKHLQTIMKSGDVILYENDLPEDY